MATRCYHPVTGQVRPQTSSNDHLQSPEDQKQAVWTEEKSSRKTGEKALQHIQVWIAKLDRAPLNPQFLASCDMEWVAGDWEPCTTSCGKDGTRHREVKTNKYFLL